jgi:tetratricopeptide (TPR) repeat protein
MTEQKSKETVLMSRYFSWPVVCVLFATVVVIAHFEIPAEPGSHEGYLFTLAGYLAMSSTFIIGALLERSNPNVFSGRKVVLYRFWLAGCSIGSVLFWLILRVCPVPVWDLNSGVLFAFYSLLFCGSLFVAWLISWRSRSKGPTRDTQDENRACKNEARTPLAYVSEALYFIKLGHDDEALAFLGKAIELDPNCVLAYVNRSAVYAGRSQFRNCKEDCDNALSVSPNNTSAMINKSLALRSMGNQQDAIELCNKVLELTQDGNDASGRVAALAYCNRAYSRFLLNETDEALRDAQISVSCSTDVAYTAKCMALQAKFLAHLGRKQEAVELCNQALSVSNENEYTWRYVKSTCALVSAICGDYLEAMKDIEHVLKKHPKFGYAILVKARVLLMKNALDEALAVVNEAVELNSLDPECFSIRFLIREKQGDGKAVEDASKARELGFLRPEFI